MSKIYFINPGIIDLDAALVLGVNAKNSPDAIGFFGSGLKYAISVLLRTNHQVSIWRGGEEFEFTAKPKTSRGKTYNQVCCNSAPLGFTTDLGKQWEVWMALRELYSNCLDENGTISASKATWSPAETAIVVSGDLIMEAWANREKYFLTTPALADTPNLSIHAGKGVFCKGILVHERDSLFAYNLKTAKLTEDRTLGDQWSASYAITSALLKQEDVGFMKAVVADEKCWEQTLTYYSNVAIAPTTKALLQTAHRSQSIKQNSLAELAAGLLVDELITRPATSEETQMISTAWAILQPSGFDRVPVAICTSLPANTLGLNKAGAIYLTPFAFNTGQRCVTGTILEECLHSRGLYDYSRPLQNFLIDLSVRGMERAALRPERPFPMPVLEFPNYPAPQMPEFFVPFRSSI